MKEQIHPQYQLATVTCACGNTFSIGSTKAEISTEVCSNCHPFYTGQKKLMDATGRVERFTKMAEKTAARKKSTPSSSKKLREPKAKKEETKIG